MSWLAARGPLETLPEVTLGTWIAVGLGTAALTIGFAAKLAERLVIRKAARLAEQSRSGITRAQPLVERRLEEARLGADLASRNLPQRDLAGDGLGRDSLSGTPLSGRRR